jgi:hypothetical protein
LVRQGSDALAPMLPANRIFTGRRRLPVVFAISSIAGVLAVLLSTGPNPRAMQVSAAATHVFVDTTAPAVTHRQFYPVATLIRRGELLGQTITTPPVLERVARRTGIPVAEIGSDSRTTANVPVDLTQPGSEQRADAIVRSGKPYSVEAQARLNTPILDVYARAPTTGQAVELADAAVLALRDEMTALADEQHIAPEERLVLRQLAPARGGVVSAGMPMAIAFFAFVLAFVLTAAGLLYLTADPDKRPPARAFNPARADDWPRTTRVLPWMFAGFLAVLWLIPFNDIQLSVHLPIDLKFDRLVLPFVAATWIIGLALGVRMAPRMRPTWIHGAIAAFVVCAFVSVILDARYLNQTLELEVAVKQLPLLIAYVSLFLIASSAIRATEVGPFLTFTLILAVITAIGIIIEYRFHENLFYNWSAKLLPGIFTVPRIDASAVDNIGRRMVRGPAALPLETVAMLAMALPISLVSAMQATSWRSRILYGLATCLILAAAFATYRKSALLAPLSVIATVAYFRRRELLKLAPLGFVLIVVIHIAAPGALGKTTTQFDPSQLGVSTVSDRAADYDAVRPDLWTHLIFGRGWGSYDWLTYRILDSELLHRTLEMGVVGLLAYVGMILSVVFSARRAISEREPQWAPMALMGAAAAISFLMVSTLFDVLAFPHATYIFLYTAGLTSVVVRQRSGAYADLRPQGAPAGTQRARARPSGDALGRPASATRR